MKNRMKAITRNFLSRFPLTDAERSAVYIFLVEGVLTIKEMSMEIGTAESTAKKHMYTAFRKCDCANKYEFLYRFIVELSEVIDDE